MNRQNRSPAPASAIFLAAILCAQPAFLEAAADGENTTLARRLYDSYRGIKTISCEIRKTVTTSRRTERWLSRIHYQAPDHIHVHNVAPFKRRIIADGSNLYYHVTGHAKGFSAPVSKLKEPMLSNFRDIPATPMEHLLKLLDCPETTLPGTKDHPVRRGYRAGPVLVVLSCDADGRLVQVDFFKTPKAKTLVAQYTYSSFRKTPGGAWIPQRHRAKLFLPDDEIMTETRRVDNLVLDEPIAASLFDASLFFKDVEFVSDPKETTE